jgi:hypothetical protein
MLRGVNEGNFRELREVSYYRLSPERIFVGFIGAFVFSGVMSAVTAFALDYSTTITGAYWPLIQKIDLGLLLLQFLALVFFAFPGQIYRFQKLQSVILCLVTLKLSIDGYKMYFLSLDDRNSSENLLTIGKYVIVGGLILLVITTLRAMVMARMGKLTQDGSYLYPVSRRTAWIIAIILLAVLFISFILGRGEYGGDAYRNWGPVPLLVIFSILQYALAIAWPEFFLLAYAKLKFSGFALERPSREARAKRNASVRKVRRLDRVDEDKTREATGLSIGATFSWWWSKPLQVMKSRAGWKLERRAPFWMMIVVWLELGLTLGVSLLLVTFLNGGNRSEFAVAPAAYADGFIYMGLFAALIAVTAIRIGYGIGRWASRNRERKRGA